VTSHFQVARSPVNSRNDFQKGILEWEDPVCLEDRKPKVFLNTTAGEAGPAFLAMDDGSHIGPMTLSICIELARPFE